MAAGKKAASEGAVVEVLSPLVLRREIDAIPTYKDGWSHIRFGDLQSWYADYLYLYRLKDPVVLENPVRNGLNQLLGSEDFFFFAEGIDAATGRYIGLKAGHHEALLIQLTKESLIVHPTPALAQRAWEEEEERRRVAGVTGGGTGTGGPGPGPIDPPPPPPPPPIVEVELPKRYFGSMAVNPQTISSNVNEISQHVVAICSRSMGRR